MEPCVPGLTKVLSSQQMQLTRVVMRSLSTKVAHQLNFLSLNPNLDKYGLYATITLEAKIIFIIFILEDPDRHKKRGNDLMWAQNLN